MKRLIVFSALFLLVCISPYWVYPQSLVQHEVLLKGIPGVSAGNIRATPDNGFVIAGTYGADPNGNYARPVLIKTDAALNIEWQHLLYQSDNGVFPISYGVDAAYTGGDTWVLLGVVNRNMLFNANYIQGQHDIFLTKIKSDGTVLWTRNYGRGLYNNDAFSYHDIPYSLETLPNNAGFLISGYSSDNNNPHPFYLRLDKDGLVSGNNPNTWANRLHTTCNTIIMVGTRGSYRREMIPLKNSTDVFTAVACGEYAFFTRLKANGTPVWEKSIPVAAGIGDDLPEPFNLIFAAGYQSFINNIEQMPNGDIAIAGITFGFAGVANPDGSWGIYNPVSFIAIITENGVFKKGNFFFHPTGNTSGQTADLFVTDMKILPNGHFLLTGNISPMGNNIYKVFLMEYALNDLSIQNHSPNKIKMHVFGTHTVNTIPYGLDMPKLAFEPDGDPVVLYDDMKVRVFDNFANTQSTSTPGCSDDVQITSTGMDFSPQPITLNWFPVTGGTLTGWGSNPLAAYDSVTLNCNGFLTALENEDNPSFVRFYPNPNPGTFTLAISEAPTTMEIYDCTGKCIHQEKNLAANQTFSFDDYPSGIYFIRVASSEKNQMLKWIKE